MKYKNKMDKGYLRKELTRVLERYPDCGFCLVDWDIVEAARRFLLIMDNLDAGASSYPDDTYPHEIDLAMILRDSLPEVLK